MSIIVELVLVRLDGDGLPPFAGGLEKRDGEATLDLTFQDEEDIGTFISVNGSVLFILAGGYFEIGPVYSYARIEGDDGSFFDGYGFGPRAEINFLPDLSATPFITGSFLFLGGDLGDVFDDEVSVGAGIKIFIGDSAALRITGSRITRSGEPGLEDQEATLITAGFSVFLGD